MEDQSAPHGIAYRLFCALLFLFAASVIFSLLLNAAVRRAAPYLPRWTAGTALPVTFCSLHRLQLLPWKGLLLEGLVLRLDPGEAAASGTSPGPVAIEAKSIRVAPKLSRVVLEVNDFSISPEAVPPIKDFESGESYAPVQSMAFEGRLMRAVVPFNFFSPFSSLARSNEMLREFAASGRTSAVIELDGKSRLQVGAEAKTIKVRIARMGDETRMTFDVDDLREVLMQSGEYFSEPEVRLIADDPMRCSLLLTLKHEARLKAEAAFPGPGSDLQRKSYERVIWSYLLTKDFGEHFAGLVAAAHQEGDASVAPIEREKAHKQYLLGRRYAVEGEKEEDLLRLISSDD